MIGILFVFMGSAHSQDCSAITKFGIFDVHKTKSEDQFALDIIHWLQTNEFKTEADARSAALKTGIIIPGVNIPVNSDGSYGDSHSSTWSKAVAEYLEIHVKEFHTFSSDVQTANPNIVNAWKECVNKVVGLVCYAHQTANPAEIMLNMEVRPKTLNVGRLRVAKVEHSPNIDPLTKFVKREFGTSVTSLIYVRTGTGEAAIAPANFVVTTNNSEYQCNAEMPEVVWPEARFEATYKDATKVCEMSRIDPRFVGQGPKVGDKHLFGFICDMDGEVTSVDYLGCSVEIGGSRVANAVPCNFMDYHGSLNLLQGKRVVVRFATNSSDNCIVAVRVHYKSEGDKKCVANCNAKQAAIARIVAARAKSRREYPRPSLNHQ
jgi:hypothetical protein